MDGALNVPQVYCNGEEVTSMGGTQESYTVDVWSGNHPFYNVSVIARPPFFERNKPRARKRPSSILFLLFGLVHCDARIEKG